MPSILKACNPFAEEIETDFPSISADLGESLSLDSKEFGPWYRARGFLGAGPFFRRDSSLCFVQCKQEETLVIFQDEPTLLK